jgi:hypothetical protein|tara:strand:- start:972 stop:1121 length:150 start_codon:yes stop_codon:yes gene_type:complete
MKLEELANLMGKTKEEVEQILEENDVIELKLTERKGSETKDKGNLNILN